MIPKEKWQWFGLAGHFCGGHKCRFHLATKVGRYLISTVGAYHSSINENEPTEIGCDRLYETMVFKAGKPCAVEGCMCGMPTIDGSELDFDGYMTARDAQRGHMRMCRKWAAKGK